MILQNDPIYRVDLTQYAYGISAPSSVLIDMVLAGIPTAVWQDADRTIDAGNYSGLTQVSSLAEWIAFADAAIADPSPFVQMQKEFIESTSIVVDRADVRTRYLDLIRSACGGGPGARPRSDGKRVMFFANGHIPTLDICFLTPLAPLFENGSLDPLVIVEGQIRKAMGPKASLADGQAWLSRQIDEHQPEIVIFCRYSGPLAQYLVELLHERDIPVVYHVDDDLMNVPIEIGEVKFKEHNSPERLLSVSALFAKADLVYCSTDRLMQRIEELGYTNNLRTGRGHCSGTILNRPIARPVRTIGYMGFDHAHDLDMILPDLIAFLRERPEVRFELFGTIPIPEALLEFGDRISTVLPVRPYQAFLKKLADLDWDIGIAPLENTHFNYYKANNKWIEYTSAGYAVVASAGMSYDQCCADDCGILVERATGWRGALNSLCDDPERRQRLVVNAQERLRREYSHDALRQQVLEMFDEARSIRSLMGSAAA
jgi:glycosyltransferase involved in cell wall biosynthesis